MCRLLLTASRHFLGCIVASSRDVRVRRSAIVERYMNPTWELSTAKRYHAPPAIGDRCGEERNDCRDERRRNDTTGRRDGLLHRS